MAMPSERGLDSVRGSVASDSVAAAEAAADTALGSVVLAVAALKALQKPPSPDQKNLPSNKRQSSISNRLNKALSVKNPISVKSFKNAPMPCETATNNSYSPIPTSAEKSSSSGKSDSMEKSPTPRLNLRR